jgi:hypothetical protein
MEERVYYATTYKDAETKAKRLINKELVRS